MTHLIQWRCVILVRDKKLLEPCLTFRTGGIFPDHAVTHVDVGTSVLSEQSLFYTLLLGSFLANLTNRQEAKSSRGAFVRYV